MTVSKRFSQGNKSRTSYANIDRDKQRGVVLIVSLIFLIALTAVASALMLNSTTDMKMSGASEMQVVANQEAYGAMDELIFRQIQSVAAQNEFKLPIVLYQNGARSVLPDLISTNTMADITAASIGIQNNEFNLEVGCPRITNPSSGVICNIFQVQLSKNYGRNNTSTVQVSAGIVQKLSTIK